MVIFSCSKAQANEIKPQEVISLVNKSRLNKGLPALVENQLLNKAAKAKANDMLKKDYFSHTSPEGFTSWHWFNLVGYEYKNAGENLAVNYENAASQHKDWMNSKTHRENILNGKYSEIGIAIAKGNINGKTSYVTVQLFGTPLHIIANPKKKSVSSLPEIKQIAGEADIAKQETIAVAEKLSFEIPKENLKQKSYAINNNLIETGIGISLVVLFLTFIANSSVIFIKFIRRIYPIKNKTTLPTIIIPPTSMALLIQNQAWSDIFPKI